MRRQGDYVLLQVLPNPYDARRSMLVVGYNSSALLKRHLLLRRIRLTGDRRFSGRGCRMGKEGDETVGATEGKTAPSALDAGGKGPLGPPA